MKSIFLKIGIPAKTILLSFMFLLAAESIGAGDAASAYDGLFGRALKNAIGANKPMATVSSATAHSVLLNLSGNICQYSAEPINTLAYDYYLPPEWIVVPSEMAELLTKDMYNMAIVDASASTLRNGFPFGQIAALSASANGCVAGENANHYVVFEPAAARKGAIARLFFYFASLYPAELWEGNGAVVFNDFNPYPTLSSAITDVYLAWNRTYPPSESELEANNRIEAIQGNRNAFVDNPELAEHIWGSKKSVPFRASTDPDTPDHNRQPLKSHYLKTENICLWWPTAEADAIWSVDGNRTSDKMIKASDLDPGQHEIEFEGATRRGKIIINIMPE